VQKGAGAVELTLHNGSEQSVGYNLCSSGLQRWSGSEWQAVQTGEVCTMELRTLAPGGSAIFEKQLPPDLSSGDYRYVTSVEIPLGGGMQGVASEPFRAG
jgi:hypothetical protein